MSTVAPNARAKPGSQVDREGDLEYELIEMSDEDERNPSDPESPPDEGEDERRARRRQLERLLRDTIRGALEKGLEAGLGTISRTDKAIRGVVSSELPREAVQFVFQQVEDTKSHVVRVVAREVREFLEATDLAAEIQRVLTSLSFEVKTEIRFIPNEAGGIRPKVRARAAPRRKPGDRQHPGEPAPSADADEGERGEENS